MKALISPNESIKYTQKTSFTLTDPDTGEEEQRFYLTTQDIPNAIRIAQVEETEFEVGGNLYWIDCDSTVNPSTHYYDTSDSTIKLISDYTPS